LKRREDKMRNILFVSLFFVSILSFKYAYSEDDLLAVNVNYDKEKASPLDKSAQKNERGDGAISIKEKTLPDDESDKELERMKAYRELVQDKQKELEVIKLELERENLLLKKKEAEKGIYQIDNTLPGSAKKDGMSIGSVQDTGSSSIDPSDIKIQLLVIADDLKEGQITLKGGLYGFKEGDVIASKFTVEKIEPSGVTLKEPSGEILKVNFMD